MSFRLVSVIGMLMRSLSSRVRKKLGVTVEAQLWTVGNYGGVAILSGDEKPILRCLTQVASLGNVRTQTLQAFNAEELKAIVRA